jgi:hypothetical protein
LRGLPITPVRILHAGPLDRLDKLTALCGHSAFIRPGHLAQLQELCLAAGLDPARALAETDPETQMEGLYLKVEEEGVVTARYKHVRTSFLTAVLQSGSHWLSRPIIANQLAAGVDIFAP